MNNLQNIQFFEKGKLLGEGRHKEVFEILEEGSVVPSLVVAFIKQGLFTPEEQQILIQNQINSMIAMASVDIPIYGYIGAASDLASKSTFIVKDRSKGVSLRDFNQSFDDVYNNISSIQVKKCVKFFLKNLLTDYPVDIDKPLDNIFYDVDSEEYYNVDSLEPDEKIVVYRLKMVDLLKTIYMTFSNQNVKNNNSRLRDFEDMLVRVVKTLNIPDKDLADFSKEEIKILLDKFD